MVEPCVFCGTTTDDTAGQVCSRHLELIEAERPAYFRWRVRRGDQLVGRGAVRQLTQHQLTQLCYSAWMARLGPEAQHSTEWPRFQAWPVLRALEDGKRPGVKTSRQREFIDGLMHLAWVAAAFE